LAAISLATVPVIPLTFVKFNFKFENQKKVMKFPKQKYADMHLLNGEARGNVTAARQPYGERFPHRVLPSRSTFTELHLRLCETGSVVPQMRGRGRHRSDFVIDAEEAILDIAEENPGVSTRQLTSQAGISRDVVMRTLQEQLLYPYHIQRVQALVPEDYPKRTEFCQWFQHQQDRNELFSRNILACDESLFTRDGIMNYHNAHVWADACMG
jgi:hypothetical protein